MRIVMLATGFACLALVNTGCILPVADDVAAIQRDAGDAGHALQPAGGIDEAGQARVVEVGL